MLRAIDKGDIESVRLFLTAKLELNPQYGQTPLHRAVAKRQNSIVDLLVASGASANNPGSNGDSEPLDIAIFYCDEALVLKLISAGANINKKSDVERTTPLAKAKLHAIERMRHLARAIRDIGPSVAVNIALHPPRNDFTITVMAIREFNQTRNQQRLRLHQT